LNSVATFVAVVEADGFTAAAARLGLPKSVVSRRVALLERSLGVRLLQRTTRRLHLTDAGTRYYQQASHAIGGLDEARRAVGSLQEQPQGTVRVTAPPDLPLQEFSRVLADFTRLYPRVRVELEFSSRVVDVVAEGFDLALRAGQLGDSSLVARKLMTSVLVLVASPSYLEKHPAPQKPAELADHDCVLYKPQNGRSRWTLVGPEGESSVDVRGRVSVDIIEYARSLAMEGAGIAFVPDIGCGRDVAHRQLVRVLPKHRGQRASLSLVYSPSRYMPQAVVALRDHLTEHLGAAIASASSGCSGGS
jgi:DNA-binding transcriptional LysR family regulator